MVADTLDLRLQRAHASTSLATNTATRLLMGALVPAAGSRLANVKYVCDSYWDELCHLRQDAGAQAPRRLVAATPTPSGIGTGSAGAAVLAVGRRAGKH